ncbi:flagellin [Roseicyclus sp. F158]|uniref:Flagellin n=1 Tax=Tropicimonas omnivorans TaxID=3075590 RepID=A0ABU3DD68_9RHOB|nr:flagellin [Roseicyclus sp. F158]MDT0681669.1 flagellin [Roseicyclus sp. F158]
MTMTAIGDLARTFVLRNHNTELKGRFDRLTDELSSGRIADLGAKVRGDWSVVAGMETSLKRLESFDMAVSEAASYTAGMQSALGAVASLSEDLGASLLVAGSGGSDLPAENVGRDALASFEGAVRALNVQAAGRSLFAGAAPDSPALSEPGDMLNDIRAAVGGATTAGAITTAVEAWFAPGGGFDAAYLGSATSAGPFAVGQGTTVGIDVTAEDGRLRDVLAGHAMATFLADGTLSDADEKVALAAYAGAHLLSADAELSKLRAEVGGAEAQIERAGTRNAAERTSLEIARTELVSADPFERASELEAVRTKLEMLYSLTVRSANLSLMEYMR